MNEQGSEDEDKESKTEEPSHKRLETALEEGRIIYSREVTSALILSSITLLLLWILPFSIQIFINFLRKILALSWQFEASMTSLKQLIKQITLALLVVVGPIFVSVIASSIFSAFIQQGHLNFSAKPLLPNLNRISPLQGLKRIFSMRGVTELFKSIIKVLIVGGLIFLIIKADVKGLALYINSPINAILANTQQVINHIMICLIIASIAIAAIDYIYQRHKYFESLRMSRKEVKEEYKQLEGNPEVKNKRKSIQHSLSKQRIERVRNAAVIITNPEHYAVALEYKRNTSKAPVVLAKGKGYLALRIRTIGDEEHIPVVANPPLARALYKEVEVGSMIKVHHYEAVAKVISYIYGLKAR